MVFCEECGNLMHPSWEDDKDVLKCSVCDHTCDPDNYNDGDDHENEK